MHFQYNRRVIFHTCSTVFYLCKLCTPSLYTVDTVFPGSSLVACCFETVLLLRFLMFDKEESVCVARPKASICFEIEKRKLYSCGQGFKSIHLVTKPLPMLRSSASRAMSFQSTKRSYLTTDVAIQAEPPGWTQSW